MLLRPISRGGQTRPSWGTNDKAVGDRRKSRGGFMIKIFVKLYTCRIKKMKGFEKITQKPWLLYTIMFILLLAIGVLIRWRDPRGVLWGDNLLQSAIGAVMITAGFAVGDRHRRKNERTRKEIEERLKDKE